MELRWVITWITLVFAISFSLTYYYFTNTFYGVIAYIPWLISISYVTGVEITIYKNL